MGYRKNLSDREIDNVENAAADSTIVVHQDAEVRHVGNPTGAGVNPVKTRRGVVETVSDKPQDMGYYAGKKRVKN